ncbi:MAG: efflux RND transporter periplasmic adaptor subunit [Planctomycetes bacterium]|nr:efflux RND transporter periplasmic adaptor subunit [Planctomycetota bacterium]
MAVSTRRWLWLAGMLVLLVVALGLAQAQGWLNATWNGFSNSNDTAAHSQHEGMQGMPGMKMGDGGESMPMDSGVSGYAPVMIEPGLQQRIGVTIGQVEREPLRMSVKTIGIIRPDETRTARVHLKTEGWVEELFVNFTGQKVQQGDPLLAIYSPEFLTAQVEYLVARESEQLGGGGRGGRSLAQTSLRKLRLWDVPPDELRELERTGRARENLTLRSPVSGTVLEKNVLQEERVTPQRELYVISDLSTVWVQAKIYQYELPHVELGKPATVTIPGLPGRRFEGTVVFIQPTVEEATRTVEARVELPNPDGLLKPGMFVEVEIQHPMGEGLLVPAAAVFRTGERDIVFRAEEGDRFVPVVVEISPMKFAEERYHVLKGLNAGERIITSANFLIDSESRLRSGGGGMMPGMEMDMP